MLFTNVGSKSPWGITWQVDAVFSPNELLADSLTCIKVIADMQECVTVLGVYRLPWVVTPAVLLLQRSAVCPSVATGTGIQAKSAGLPRVRAAWTVVMANALCSVLCKGHWVSCIYFWDYGSGDFNCIHVPLFRFLVPHAT